MRFDNVLTGFIAEPRGRDGLLLAALLARQAGGHLTVATVQPPAWSAPGPARAEESAWRAYLDEQAEATLAKARELADELAGGDVDYVVHSHKGSGRGLVELARKLDADVVVIGSASGGGKGRISVGSTADQLLHASSVPVLLAPRGYADAPPEAFERITLAYRRGPRAEAAVASAAQAAVRLDVPLRLMTLLVSSGRRVKVEEDMLERLRDLASADLAAAAEGHRRRVPVEVEVPEGRTVAQALAAASWLPGELLVCASSGSGPLRRVFLGDTSVKIVRAATRPVMILTRQQ
ncbi:universal stress protein [Nonomuraea muscovyensis]|uniref:Nucleotide-binding universal stress UspA family protein n=1 Tax=Nonomuraea muscovyensis TaxID=1124761 RepID=A0A7X0EU52_9ACTN|nr:universal stress protein [Nonomuraea muscovyensis]MBB6344058.1 nucleotide-binding universal stress UspA family protein [Nonomuraea muscovyensis]